MFALRFVYHELVSALTGFLIQNSDFVLDHLKTLFFFFLKMLALVVTDNKVEN